SGGIGPDSQASRSGCIGTPLVTPSGDKGQRRPQLEGLMRIHVADRRRSSWGAVLALSIGLAAPAAAQSRLVLPAGSVILLRTPAPPPAPAAARRADLP